MQFGHMKIGQKYFSVMKASLIYLEMMEKNNVKRRIGERLSAKCTKKTVKFGAEASWYLECFLAKVQRLLSGYKLV